MQETKKPASRKKTAATSKKANALGGGQPGLFAGQFGGFNINAIRISLEVIYALWRANGDLFASVREICTSVGAGGHEWKDKDGNVVPPTDPRAVAATALLNLGGSWNRTRRKIMQAHSVSGNAYVHLERGLDSKASPIKLNVIDPRTIRVVTDKYGTILKWMQQVRGETVTFEPDEIMHYVEDGDPDSSVFGISGIETIVWDVRTDLAASKSNYAFFENDATPATQYILEDGIADDEYDKVITKLKEQMQGSTNRHKALAMKGVKEIKTLSLTNKDMEFELLRRLTTEKVCAVMGVPKSILNYTDGVNYSTNDGQMKKFYEGTIEPKEGSFDEFVNLNVCPALGIELTYVTRKQEFDSGEWTEASTRADVQLGIMTVNEARERRKMAKFDPMTEGEYVDKPLLYNGAAVVPLEDVGIDPQAGDPTDPNTDPAAADSTDGKLMVVKPRARAKPRA